MGLGRSGKGAARLLGAAGASVYASDLGTGDALEVTAHELRDAGIEVDLGRHDLDKLARCETIVVSPGIPPDATVLQAAASLPVISELELAFSFLDAPLIAVTGTNGKTTTTAWIGDMIGRAGLRVGVGGNIGEALSDIAARDVSLDWVVAEVSSFQLAHIVDFDPAIGVLLNLGADHLDRYESIDAYHADKARLFVHADEESRWVLNGEDAKVRRMADGRSGSKLYFRVETDLPETEEGAWLAEGGELTLRCDGETTTLVNASELKTLGDHNVANALAAALVAYYVGLPVDAMREGLRGFEPLPHRLQPVAEIDGVLWINDSKATNVGSARVAIRAVDRPIVLLLGGRPKGESFADLASEARGRVRTVIAFGEAASQVETDLEGYLHVDRVEGSFAEVVDLAAAQAQPGDVVLLAPACASFDMFHDYVDRGEQFIELVGRRAA